MNTTTYSTIVADATNFFDFAERHGLALLEVHAGQKRPVGNKWETRSSKDRKTWDMWLSSGSNIGVLAGASDIATVDIEAGRWEIAAEWFRNELGIEIPDPHVFSARGGWHIFFKLPDGFKGSKLKFPWGDLQVGNAQTVAPPSQFDGKPYRFFSKTAELYDGAVLLKLWERKPQAERPAVPAPPPPPDGATRGEKVLHTEYHNVAQAPAGTRNHQLNVSALLLGKYVGSGDLDEQTAIDTLQGACEVSGLLKEDGKKSCLASIQSGLKAGKADPHRTGAEMFANLVVVFDDETRTWKITAPPPPSPEEMAKLAEDLRAGGFPMPGDEEEGFTEIALDDFPAYLPLNQFIYLPTRALWPATTINTTLPPVEIGTKEVKERDGTVSEVPVTIPASKWLNRKKGVACMTWAPGYPMIVHGKTIQRDGWVDNPGKTTFNEYREPTIAHVPGDPSPWVDHIGLLCGEHAQHVLYYFAHRVQRPEQKINHALVFGGSQGIGKDTAFEPLKAAVGAWNFKEASPVTMMGQFDPYKKCVVLRVNEARDLGDMTRNEFYERIKNLSAAPPDVLPVNEKYLGETNVPNVCGLLVTTNHQDAIALPSDDRRCFVMWSTLTKEDFTEKYWTDLYAWFDDGGREIVAHYLANMDLSGFNPKAYPPRTEAWHQMVGFSAAPEDAELADTIDALKSPDALTVAAVTTMAAIRGEHALVGYLRERRNSRSIPVRFNKCGYVSVRNKDAKDGHWRVSGRRQVVYAKATLSERDRMAAAMSLATIPMPPPPG